VKSEVWYAPEQNIFGIVRGDFIKFWCNNEMEESFFPFLRDEGHWIYVGDL